MWLESRPDGGPSHLKNAVRGVVLIGLQLLALRLLWDRMPRTDANRGLVGLAPMSTAAAELVWVTAPFVGLDPMASQTVALLFFWFALGGAAYVTRLRLGASLLALGAAYGVGVLRPELLYPAIICASLTCAANLYVATRGR